MRIVFKAIAIFFLLLICSLSMLLSGIFLYLNPSIPEIETFSRVSIKAPLKIYSHDDFLIQEFGERLRPITFNEIPPLFIKALLDTEDKRFFEHRGIDLVTLLNGSWQLIRNKGAIRSGASTITMQLVKNISGQTEIRFIRKFKEMLLALKIETELSKEEILELYLNIIPFGKHSFGVQAASNTYYGKDLSELNLAQMAMLAGIPQAPEAGNPINGPERAKRRRDLVLKRMLEQKSISASMYQEARAEPITARVFNRNIELSAPYVAEMVRKTLLKEVGRKAYTGGYIVKTTIRKNLQVAAQKALQKKLIEYDRRHGYRGPGYRSIQGTDQYLAFPEAGYPENWTKTLEKLDEIGNQEPSIVTKIDGKSLFLLRKDLKEIVLNWEGQKWARPFINSNERAQRPKSPEKLFNVGDVVRVEQINESDFRLGQIPAIQGAFVAMDPNDGSIEALVGGFDFKQNQFNHVTQARRQPGSSFKPFYYAGALENGLTAATIFNDAPLVLPGGELEETYRPKNSGDAFQGSIRLREALYRSINLVSIRVLLDLGPENAIKYVSRFGFDTSNFPKNLQLAFGGGTIALSPMEVATAYATFANGGYKIEPYFIRTIDSINEDFNFQGSPAAMCLKDCENGEKKAARVLDPRVAFIVNSMLSDAVKKGTARKATRILDRQDIHGKTGTTNDSDIWFSGYTSNLVATAWAGFSDNSPVGNREWGSTAPLEMWIDFMKEALKDSPKNILPSKPEGLVLVKIDPKTGLRANASDPQGIFEIFREEYIPQTLSRRYTGQEAEDPTQTLF
ncbi:MAG: PBP1A family penicillin-binding protein [Pseudomonadota bacterium]|nr:PBP1A family penicillin-binding protein [Pseudomonadota bacterium]